MSYNYEFDRIINEVHHYYEIQRYEEANNKINEILSLKPNDSYILYLKAKCLYHLDQYNEAEEYCKEALNYGFSAWKCNYLLGQIFMDIKKYIEAEECFLEALRENPERADIMATYGFLMLKTGYD